MRPFVKVLSEKVQARRGCPPKDEVRLVPLTDETMRNWLKMAIALAETDGVHFSVPVTPHTFRHSYIMHMLCHRQPKKVIQALVGHKDPRSMEACTRVFALELAATIAIPFTGDGRDAAEILRAFPPL
ncbi:Site-specific recombinase XerD [Enterobacter sp. CC120223-11]|nr:Site-specific recombinase XerD [Enterobacter sp. CC120223-11]